METLRKHSSADIRLSYDEIETIIDAFDRNDTATPIRELEVDLRDGMVRLLNELK